MSVFREYESQVVRRLLRCQYSGNDIDTIVNEATVVSFDHTGVGYFLTVTHPLLPSSRTVCSQPMLQGHLRGVELGFVVFLEDHALTLECFSEASANQEELVPEDIREQPVEIAETALTVDDAGGVTVVRDDRGATLRASVNYFEWLGRVVGWDAALPLLVSTGSVMIARALKNEAPADVLALVGLPALAFSFRYFVGIHQIRRNACGSIFRRFQMAALVIALFVLAFVDFFVALRAFAPKGGGPRAEDMLPVFVAATLTYATLVAFAMFPGRRVATIPLRQS